MNLAGVSGVVAVTRVPVTGVASGAAGASIHVLRVDGRPVSDRVVRALPYLPGTGGHRATETLAAVLDGGAAVLGKLIGRGRHTGWGGWVAPVEALLLWKGTLWLAPVASTAPPWVPCADEPGVAEPSALLHGLDPEHWEHLPEGVRAAVAAAPWLTLGV